MHIRGGWLYIMEAQLLAYQRDQKIFALYHELIQSLEAKADLIPVTVERLCPYLPFRIIFVLFDVM